MKQQLRGERFEQRLPGGTRAAAPPLKAERSVERKDIEFSKDSHLVILAKAGTQSGWETRLGPRFRGGDERDVRKLLSRESAAAGAEISQ